jgi:mono/diheme cytochrome c family protein
MWTLAIAAAAAGAASVPGTVTFYGDVLPVLQKHCQTCHRPGEAAPMAFLSYGETRPWAKAIRAAVLSKKMPPWLADPHAGKFSNDRTLSAEEIRTLTAWADGGAPEGDAKAAPAPVEFVEGWAIGKPDLVLSMPDAFAIPATGTVEYQYVIIPTGLKEDKWIRMTEARPGNRAVTHHIIAFTRDASSTWYRDQPAGVPFVPKSRKQSEGGGTLGELIAGYAPGHQPLTLRPGQAKLLKAGSDLVFQLHYTTNGKAATDRSSIGLVFADQPPRERVFTANALNNKFTIPAGAAAHPVEAQITLQEDAQLLTMMPHMHLRGKDFEYRAVYPTGETETLLRVPKWDFNWQLVYYLDKPKTLPKGTRIECTAHFDNSPNNAANPDAAKEVKWGDQSWEEMMIGWFDLAIDVSRKPADVLRKKPS